MIALNQTQLDCLDHKGNCATCPSNLLTSQRCMTKYSNGVAQVLGLQLLNANKPVNPATSKRVVCGNCGSAFMTSGTRAKYCARCSEGRTSMSQSLLTCRDCGVRFWGTSRKVRCEGCKRGRIA